MKLTTQHRIHVVRESLRRAFERSGRVRGLAVLRTMDPRFLGETGFSPRLIQQRISAISGVQRMSTKFEFDEQYQEILCLPGGERVKLRLVQPGDKERLRKGFHNLSMASRQQRFFGGKQSISDAELRYFTEIDHTDHLAIGAVELDRLGGEQEGVAIGRFVRLAAGSDCAEVAITVIDRMQGRGVGGTLLAKLVAAAAEREIKRFRFECMSHNLAVRKLVRRVCKLVEFVDDDGITIAEVDLPDQRPGSLQHASDAVERLFLLLRSYAADLPAQQVNLGLSMARWMGDVVFAKRNFWLGM